MDFNSQICTTKEQSERLLALGLRKETADCILVENPFEKDRYVMFPIVDVDETLENEMSSDPILAWSLHRLIELLPQWIDTTETSLKLTIDQGKLVCYRGIFDGVQTFVFGHTSLYDSIIDIIEKLIKEGYFNKEYLE